MTRETSIATTLGIVAALTLCFLIANQAPSYSGEFTITLSQNNTKMIADKDILLYNATSHEFTLTNECVDRLKPMGWRLSGNFTMVINGEVVLRGIFVSPIVSRSYEANQVVLLYPTFDLSNLNYGVAKLQMGYPWDLSAYLDFSNPLDNSKIAEHFEITDRLIN